MSIKWKGKNYLVYSKRSQGESDRISEYQVEYDDHEFAEALCDMERENMLISFQDMMM